jgi:methylmalonyl-CoA mutase cobalamin-binding subunit
MSSAGRAANSSGCVTTPKEREIGLNGFAAQIRFSSFTGSYGMATADHREPCESRGSRTVLGAPGGEIPPGDSTIRYRAIQPRCRPMSATPPRAEVKSRYWHVA